MPQILLYAELLLNIRTVSLTATLQTESNKETKASLSADGETISLTHDGETASIRLPTKISGGGAALTLPAAPAKELTLRLQLEEDRPGLLKLGSSGRGVKITCGALVGTVDERAEGFKLWKWAVVLSFGLWVFTPDLSFSSSKHQEERDDPTRAMKIFWKDAPEKVESSFSSEELALPSPVFGALRTALRGSAELLPASAREFQDWSVGFLERFTDDEG
ncbi:hypothetical protein H2199_002647 [Coniosporium tulheliwenetii]|uniref:Uncharacterized protein n=1 Tax=Coniosporium tulheliwenetii TaxID=3383036 RepID=A0ACC2ZGQ3_9PEZI|nr:hypothetical protein H2199_002647 [Cladosporium sp. JES 115]